MECPRCHRTKYKYFDREYLMCANCSELRLVNEPAVHVVVGYKKEIKQQGMIITTKTIKDCVVANIDAITKMRKAEIGWKKVIKYLGLTGSCTIVAKHYNNAVGLPDYEALIQIAIVAEGNI